jgi:hypothetical protein
MLRHVYATDVARRRIRDVRTLWVRARARGLIGARSCGAGGYGRLGVYALRAYGVFKVRFFVFLCAPAFFFSLSIIRVWFDRVVACLWQVREIVGLRSLVGYHVRHNWASYCVLFCGARNECSLYLLQHAATARLAPSHSIIDKILGVFYSAEWTER